MEDVVTILEAADSGWAVIALFLVGLYAFLFKFGKEMLDLARSSNNLAKESKDEAKQISEAIVTNHGSKNIGDAVDRLSAWVMTMMDQADEVSEKVHRTSEKVHRLTEHGENHQLQLARLSHKLEQHIDEGQDLVAFGRELMSEAVVKVEEALTQSQEDGDEPTE